MKIVIIGCGKVGFTLAEQLSREDHDIVVVDENHRYLEEAQDTLDIMTVEGNGASLEVLRDAGTADADVLIATTSADEINLLCCISAKKLGCRHTIARVRNPQYTQQIAFLKDELGLSLSVNPEQAAAQEIFKIIQIPSFLKRDSFYKGRVELVELKLTEGGKLDGKRIMDAVKLLGLRVLICAVERDGKVFIPNGRFELKGGDRITVTAARSLLAKLIHNLDLEHQKIRGVMIIGCSRVAEYLAEELIKSGVDVKLIEKDAEKCRQFSINFPEAVVINGDASERGFLEAQGLEMVDAVITLTGNDEENLITSIYANHLGVTKTVTKVDRNEYARLFDDRIGSIVCPKDLTSNEILRYIRAMGNRGDGTVKALHRIVDGKAEALEFAASTPAAFLGVPLAKLNIKPNTLIACICRSNQIIIPKGDDEIRLGDTLIVVTGAEQSYSDLNDIFEKEAVKQQ